MKSQIEADFDDVLIYLKKLGHLKDNINTRSVKKLRHIHYITHSFLFITKKFQTNNHARIFLDEIISSYIQFLPMLTHGFYKVSAFLMRDILENTLKYVYYYNHPVELLWVESGSNYFVEIDQLLNYLEKHPTLNVHIQKENIRSKSKTLYQELSSYIHSKGSRHMHMIKYLEGFKSDERNFTEFYKKIVKITDITLFVILLFNWEKYVKIGTQEKRIILDSLSRNVKRYLQSI